MPLQARSTGPARETVACPNCGKERPAAPGVYVCADCGEVFTVHNAEGAED